MEILLVLLVVLLLFGSTKLPKLARSIGQASKEFKKGVNEAGTDDDAAEAKAEAKEPEAPKKDTVVTNDSVTMSRADLEAMLDERDARARKDAPPPA